jgi:hypothetical protein
VNTPYDADNPTTTVGKRVGQPPPGDRQDHRGYARASQWRVAPLFQFSLAAVVDSREQEDGEGDQAHPLQQVRQPGPPWIMIKQRSHDHGDSDEERPRSPSPKPPWPTAVGHGSPSCTVKSGIRRFSVPRQRTCRSHSGREHDCPTVRVPECTTCAPDRAGNHGEDGEGHTATSRPFAPVRARVTRA